MEVANKEPLILGDLSWALQELKLMLELEKSTSISMVMKRSSPLGLGRSNAP